MSTPTDNPGNYDFPYQPHIPGMETGGPEDLVAATRAAADVTDTVNKMTEGTGALLQTLSSNMESLKATVEALPSAFASTADHIKRGADASERLARSSERTAAANKKSKDYAESSNFSIKDTLHALSTGNVQGAIGELFQGLPGSDRFRGRRNTAWAGLGAGNPFEKLTGRGTFEGPLTAEGIGPEAPGLLARLGLAGGAAGFGAIAGLWSPAAIFGMYKLGRQINATQQEAQRVGGLTGEGRGAGFSALGINVPLLGTIGGEAGALRGSPFDLIGNQEARQIVMGVRGSGFRGGEARALEESISGIVNDLGIGVQDAMDIAIPAVKQAGMTTAELSQTLATFDDTAKSAHTSIGELTAAVKDLITNTAQFSRSAAQATPAQLQGLEGQFRGTLIARSPGQLGAFLQGSQREMIAQLSGFAPYEAYSTRFTAQFNEEFTKILVNLARAKPPAMDWQAYVAMMMLDPTWQQLFGNTPYPSIVDLLSSVWKGTNGGTNVTGYINQQAVVRNAQGRERAQQAVGSIGGDFMRTAHNYGRGVHGSEADPNKWGLVSKIDQALITQGLGQSSRAFIEQDLRTAVATGDSKSIDKALRELGDRIETSMKNVKVTSTVTVDPRYGRMLRTINTPAIEAARGQRSKQGTSDYTP